MYYPVSKTAAALGTLIALVVIPSFLSGCEFGNKESTSLSGYDTISGYYLTLPQTISFNSEVVGSAPRQKDTPVSGMPDFMKTVMANPTVLAFDDPIKGLGSIRSRSNTNIGFYTLINANAGTLGASDEESATMNGCQFVKTVTTSGTFSQLLTQQQASGVWARGKLALDFDYQYETQGEDSECAAMRGIFKTCYVDGTGCSTDQNSVFYSGLVNEIFAPFIAAGMITTDEIATTKNLRYHARYE